MFKSSTRQCFTERLIKLLTSAEFIPSLTRVLEHDQLLTSWGNEVRQGLLHFTEELEEEFAKNPAS